MTIYGLYVFDRHCTCTFYASYNGKVPRAGPSTLPNVYRPPTASSASSARDRASQPPPPWERLSGTGMVVAQSGENGKSEGEQARERGEASAGLALDEEAKLVYGVVFSLRNMVKKLAGRDDDSFHSFSTSAYKLHYLHTSTSTHFVLVTSPMAESLQFVLRQIYSGAFTEFVVRNPMIELDSHVSGRGIDNDAFRMAVEKLLLSL